MKYILLVICILTCGALYAQEVRIYFENKENGYAVLADNAEPCPVSVKLELSLVNLESSSEAEIFVLPANSKANVMTVLTVKKAGKNTSFSSSAVMNYGDHFLEGFDKDYDYFLPFSKGRSFLLYQGYNGKLSHQNENALDFTMPVGTEVFAAREGTVVSIVQNNTKVCAKEECAKYNNFILIYHPDGTFAEYSHINKNGAKVKVGDKVEKGQLIAHSGHVGWSTGPHLHLEIFKQRLTERETLETKFLVSEGGESIFLKEGETYARSY